MLMETIHPINPSIQLTSFQIYFKSSSRWYIYCYTGDQFTVSVTMKFENWTWNSALQDPETEAYRTQASTITTEVRLQYVEKELSDQEWWKLSINKPYPLYIFIAVLNPSKARGHEGVSGFYSVHMVAELIIRT